MAIKRVTIDIGDDTDVVGSTKLPFTLLDKKKYPVTQQQTGFPDAQDYDIESIAVEKVQNIPHGGETIGRTPSDLFFSFINRPEFVATFLTFCAFFLFIKSLKAFDDLLMPSATAILFNIVWFGVSLIRRFINWFKRKEVKEV